MDLVELVPNVSEGKSETVIQEIATALDGEGVWVLDRHRDESHHRAVLTAVARPEAVVEASLRLFDCALARIDLRQHEGEHPRIGAVDVLPLVALGKMDRARTKELASEIGERIASRFGLPIFLYAASAVNPENRELARLRRGGFEALARRMASSELVPDYGPRVPHPTAGASAVGARGLLIAYNVELSTPDRGAARTIARRIRASSEGGLPHVKALGFVLADRRRAQVSMNLTDFRLTSLETAFEAVVREARALGVDVVRSEVVGLVPEAARFDGMVAKLKLDRTPASLEQRITEAGAI